jgi:hypothetical protein
VPGKKRRIAEVGISHHISGNRPLTTSSQLASGLLKFRVFRLGSDENRNVRVGVFPKREEILIGRLGVSRELALYPTSAYE